MAPKGVLFSESVWDGSIFHCTKSGEGLKYACLERGPCLSGKGLLSYPFSPIGEAYPFLQVSEIFLSRPAISA